MPDFENQTITPEERGFMQIMAMAGQDLGFSTLDAIHLSGVMAGIFAARSAALEGLPTAEKAAQYRAAFERGLQHSLDHTDKINDVFTAPH